MTFGKTLSLLLKCAKIKRIQLASYLEYDVSYISRWATDKKMPSLKNDTNLFDKIATYIIKTANSSEKQAIINDFSLSKNLDDDNLKEAIIMLLNNAYKNQKNNLKNDKEETNPEIFNLSQAYNHQTDIIFNTIKETHRNKDVAKIITIPSINDFYNGNLSAFWSKIKQSLPKDISIKLKIIIHFENSELFSYYRQDIIECLTSFDNMEAMIYAGDENIDSSQSIWICKDTICVMNFFTPFFNEEKNIITTDQDLIKKYYKNLDIYFDNHSPVILCNQFEQLYLHKYFLTFMLQPSYYAFYADMMPIYMSEKQTESLAKKYHINEENLNLQLLYYNKKVHRTIVIYKSDLTDYLFSGNMYLFGQKIKLDKFQQKEHISSLIEYLENNHNLHLYILNDLNPILDHHKIKSTLYLNNNDMFFIKFKNKLPQVDYSSDLRVINLFEQFFKQIISLPKQYILTNQDALEYLKQVTDLI